MGQDRPWKSWWAWLREEGPELEVAEAVQAKAEVEKE